MHGTGLPFRRIVVGHDGTRRSDAGILLAHALCDRGGSVVVVRVADGSAAGDPQAGGDAGVGSIGVRMIGGASPTAGLLWIAEEEEADLLVLGPSHRGAAGRALGRMTAQHVLAGASCAVAVAGERPAVLRRLLVAYDAGPEAEAALDAAYAIAAEGRGTVRICRTLFGLAPDPQAVGWYAGVDRTEDHVTVEMAAAVDRAPDSIAVESAILRGSPAARILQEAGGDVDLVVCGVRRRARLSRWSSGSVADRLLSRAATALLFVPAPPGAGGPQLGSAAQRAGRGG